MFFGLLTFFLQEIKRNGVQIKTTIRESHEKALKTYMKGKNEVFTVVERQPHTESQGKEINTINAINADGRNGKSTYPFSMEIGQPLVTLSGRKS